MSQAMELRLRFDFRRKDWLIDWFRLNMPFLPPLGLTCLRRILHVCLQANYLYSGHLTTADRWSLYPLWRELIDSSLHIPGLVSFLQTTPASNPKELRKVSHSWLQFERELSLPWQRTSSIHVTALYLPVRMARHLNRTVNTFRYPSCLQTTRPSFWSQRYRPTSPQTPAYFTSTHPA